MLTYETLLLPAMTIAVTIPMLLSALLQAFPRQLSRLLPIGGSDFAQVAIFTIFIFGLVVLIVEVDRLNEGVAAAQVPDSLSQKY